ncbi:MAG: hypothetical protein NC078_09515 [Ruminococcus sp.]|nr:hypothetical protein [Ruminococcus sp.]
MGFIIRYLIFSAVILTMVRKCPKEWEKRPALTAAAFFTVTELIFLL